MKSILKVLLATGLLFVASCEGNAEFLLNVKIN
jgi:hypothetical protein